MMHKVTDLQPWECLMKRIVWKRLGEIRDKKILDFGSGMRKMKSVHVICNNTLLIRIFMEMME